jgi:uncharacterized protein YjiS (DUF1127 family)
VPAEVFITKVAPPVSPESPADVAASDAETPAIEASAFRPRQAKSPEWTREEDQRLAEAYAAGERIDLVAEEIGRPLRGTMSRAQKIGLAGTLGRRGGFCNDPDWSAEEDQILRDRYGSVRTAELAKEMRRTQSAIYSRAHQLGIKSDYIRDWSDQECLALQIAHDRGIALCDLPPALGRSFAAIAKFSENHGYKFGKRARVAETLTIEQLLALQDRSAPLPPMRQRPRPTNVRKPIEWPDTRKATFLETLERTGSIAASLTAIGLAESSRGVAYRERARDQVFSAAWDGALERSPYKPGPKGRFPAKGWPSERIARFAEAYRRTGKLADAFAAVGSNSAGAYAERNRNATLANIWDEIKAEQKAKPRDGTWTRERRDECVRHLRRTGKVAQALEDMGIERRDASTFYLAKKRFPEFGEACDAAIAAAKATTPQRARYVPPQIQRPVPTIAAPKAVSARRAPEYRPHPTRPYPNPVASQPTPIPAGPRKTDAEIAAATLRYLAERERVAALSVEPGFTLNDAKLRLQQRGRAVYRMSVHGGSADLWFVSGLGRDVTDEQLVAEARRVAA